MVIIKIVKEIEIFRSFGFDMNFLRDKNLIILLLCEGDNLLKVI